MTPSPGESKKKGGLAHIARRLSRLLVTPEEWQLIRKPLISVFILLHCLLNFCYMFNHHPFMYEVNRFFAKYFLFLGLQQSYQVFAPVPRDKNVHLMALVRYKDGSQRLWSSPRMERLDQFEKIPAERYRKFFDDNVSWENLTLFWPDIAVYVARINYFDRDNPPDTVSLIRYSSTVPSPPIPDPLNPDIALRTPTWQPNPPHYEAKLLLCYRVKSADLAEVTPH